VNESLIEDGCLPGRTGRGPGERVRAGRLVRRPGKTAEHLVSKLREKALTVRLDPERGCFSATKAYRVRSQAEADSSRWAMEVMSTTPFLRSCYTRVVSRESQANRGRSACPLIAPMSESAYV
jgi:hypothetical protein